MLWILLTLAVIAAIIIAVVLFKHWKEIRLLDPDSIRAEQERKVRDRIVQQRFDRRLRHVMAPIQRTMKGLGDRLTRSVRQAEDRLAEATGMARSSGHADDMPNNIRDLLEEAAVCAKQFRWAEAERAYLGVLQHDNRNLPAYRGLGALYLTQKQYPQARETFLFLERIHGCDDACYAGLAQAAEAEGNLTEAELRRKRAVEVAPKNAVRHAELASFYLAHGSPEYASTAAKKAADLAPDDSRALEVCIEAAILLADRPEAERRYERLRMVSDDRGRLQTLRDRIDAVKEK